VEYKYYPNNKPWITKDIIRMVKDKHLAHRTGNPMLSNLLKKQIKRAIVRAKRDYTSNINNCLVNEPAKAWRNIRRLGGLINPTTTSSSSVIKEEPDTLNSFFARFERPSTINTTQPMHSSNPTEDTAPRLSVTIAEVRSLLKQIDGRKGPGPDKLIPKVLKACHVELAPIITQLFNASIEQETTPTIWKTAIIKPIPKVPRPNQNKDYRPISITCCLCKILEKLIRTYIVSHTTLDSYQFAYQAGKSTQDAVLCLLTHISEFIDRKADYYARAMFLDFSSAFNTIDNAILISRLQHLDVHVVNWIKSFLTARIQHTEVNGRLSSKLITSTGTPQGSVLSPTLFSIYTDVIRSSFPNTTILKYADDTVILGLISNHNDIICYQSELNRISELCQDNYLILNPAKTKEMVFSTKRTSPTVDPVHLDSVPIALSEQITYLGVIIDSKLKFSAHAQAVHTKAKQRIFLINRFTRFGASEALAKQLFSSFIESHLFYCTTIIFNQLSQRDKKLLVKPFKTCAKLGLTARSFDTVLEQRANQYMLQIYLDDSHFIHKFLKHLPSGRLQAFKHRSVVGRNCFLRHFVSFINEIMF
jgi:hypothetical protein